MSWAETVLGTRLSAGRSTLESRRFGKDVARVLVPARDSVTTVDEVLEASLAAASEITVARYPSSRVRWFAHLAARAGSVIHADTLIYWRHESASIRSSERRGKRIQVAPEAAVEFVADAFAGYPNHYSANPLFDQADVLAGYQEWAGRTAARGDALGIEVEGELIALATVAVNADVLEVELAGVLSTRQRQGWYPALLSLVGDAAAERGCNAVVISTQASQTHVQRSWARAGFEPVVAFETVHLMAADDLSYS
jgi:GNAT superfamily N-acetyltransferase